MRQTDLSDWARTLQQSKMKGLFLSLIEGAGPLRLMLAQIMHSGAPFIGSGWQQKWQSAAEILEDDAKSRELSRLIREEKTH